MCRSGHETLCPTEVSVSALFDDDDACAFWVVLSSVDLGVGAGAG